MAPQTRGKERGGVVEDVGVRAVRWWRRRQLRFALGFAAHVLPITDKREAVPCGMWFRLEQVKQCWKIDPSSAAFQRTGEKQR